MCGAKKGRTVIRDLGDNIKICNLLALFGSRFEQTSHKRHWYNQEKFNVNLELYVKFKFLKYDNGLVVMWKNKQKKHKKQKIFIS